jgi:hypothetical protein
MHVLQTRFVIVADSESGYEIVRVQVVLMEGVVYALVSHVVAKRADTNREHVFECEAIDGGRLREDEIGGVQRAEGVIKVVVRGHPFGLVSRSHLYRKERECLHREHVC